MSSSSKKKGLKQGNLFSFFSKKPTTTTKTPMSLSAPSSSTKISLSNASQSPAPPPTFQQSQKTKSSSVSGVPQPRRSSPKPKPVAASVALLEKVAVGTRIKVFWQEDRQYYSCEVLKHRQNTTSYCLRYDDGETEWTDLATQTFKLLYNEDGGGGGGGGSGSDDSEDDTGAPRSSSIGGKKRQKVDDDSDDDDDENEWQDDGANNDDDESFAADDDDEEEGDDEEDQWMASDDEDDDLVEQEKRPLKKKKISKAAVKITRHDTGMSPTPGRVRLQSQASNVSSVGKSTSGNAHTTPLQQFSYSRSPKTVTSEKDTGLRSSSTFSSVQETPSSDVSPNGSALIPASSKKAPAFTKGVVNIRGSHVHNHLRFLQNPRDCLGRTPDDPNYDRRTLKYSESQWKDVTGSNMTDAVKQWWELKGRYFDTVLLFKTGKFYEMFHMDADVGVEVLDLIYMKGHIAHAGFPEISYGVMADKLVRSGYKVARVEQTETPDQLKIRKQKTKGKGPAPKVVNREVCSIMTLGTRTFCALDERNALLACEEESGANGKSGSAEGCGPLLAISEVLLDDENDSDNLEASDSALPCCEYGITLIDAIRGTVTLGQFADDVLRSRMYTLLASFAPCEILIKGGDETSKGLRSLIQAYQNNSRTPCRLETIALEESFPKSTALDPAHQRFLEREKPIVQPWDIQETIDELHRKKYFPRASRRSENDKSIARWPSVLQAVVEGGADLCLSSFGATLFYLQRNLIDQELLSMGIIKAYIPHASPAIQEQSQEQSQDGGSTSWYSQQPIQAMDNGHQDNSQSEVEGNPLYRVPRLSIATESGGVDESFNPEDEITYMQMDGTTLHNLEILANAVDFTQKGSLWSKINYTKSPHGARMLRAWLLRPLFRKADIERRADAVTSLASGAGALAIKEARQVVLCKIGDLDRLISRIHSIGNGALMSSGTDIDGENDPVGFHPNDRAVLYEGPTYTKRKVGDFSKALNGLQKACQIPDMFADMDIEPGSLLYKLVRLVKDGGLFPDMTESLDWFFDNFDCDQAANGLFELVRGTDPIYDQSCDTIARIKEELEAYKKELAEQLHPRQVARSSWKYINTKQDSKDKYLIELPASVTVPQHFIVMGKRGSGAKQVNKYRTSAVAELVRELEQAIDVQQVRKAKGMQIIFGKFDAQRALWTAAAHATAILDALGSLASVASLPMFCRPVILDCPPNRRPSINIVQGRHPCITIQPSDFVANDLVLGPQDVENSDSARMLLLSGPNMGGKSTLLRQTCLISILAQIGSYVPAESCHLTPIDCIFTRLGASDRILLGQSTFFVELAETAAALRGATRRSLVIMDELGRGTSTFDGTAIASAAVKHLVERSQCLSLFATHYHSLLDEFRNSREVRLGHMQCIVDDDDSTDGAENGRITFLYTLGPGSCPKSFGINVARLAGLPDSAVQNAKSFSEAFEEEMNGADGQLGATRVFLDPEEADDFMRDVMQSIEDGNSDKLGALWNQLKK